MDFRKLRNTDRSDVPYFVVEEKDGMLHDATRQAEYKRYRKNYRAFRGVMPELDRINNPAVAVPMDVAFWPKDAAKNAGKNIAKSVGKAYLGAMKAGIGLMMPGSGLASKGVADIAEGFGRGVGQNPELLAEFSRRFKAIVEPHKFVYGLVCSEECVPDLDALREDEHIVDNLGYRYDRNNGIYYEGTWADGELIYGMIMLVDAGILLAGEVRKGFISEGVGRTGDEVICGVFGDDGLECQEGFSWMLDSGAAFLGPHTQDMPNGMVIALNIGEGAIIKQEYRMGEPVKGISGILGRQKAKLDTKKNSVNNIIGKFKK